MGARPANGHLPVKVTYFPSTFPPHITDSPGNNQHCGASAEMRGPSSLFVWVRDGGSLYPMNSANSSTSYCHNTAVRLVKHPENLHRITDVGKVDASI